MKGLSFQTKLKYDDVEVTVLFLRFILRTQDNVKGES